MNILEYLDVIIGAFLGAIGGSLAGALSTWPRKRRTINEKFNERINFIEGGVQALLRSNIQQQYLIMMNRGYAKAYERENVFKLYEAYVGTGGNSYVKELVEAILELPLEKGKKDEHE